MSERSHPMTGPKPLTPEVLKGIVGGAQDGDRQKVDDQTAIALTAGADEASPGAPPDAPSAGNAEGVRGAATEARVAPATVPMMAGEAASQAAGGATTDRQGGDNPVVDQAPNHSQPPVEQGREVRMPELPSTSWQAMVDNFNRALAKPTGDDWREGADEAKNAQDRFDDRIKAMQTLLTANLQQAGVRFGLDAVESQDVKGTESDAKVAPATAPLMAGEATSQAAGGATIDNEGGGNPIVDQASDHSQSPAALLEEGGGLRTPKLPASTSWEAAYDEMDQVWDVRGRDARGESKMYDPEADRLRIMYYVQVMGIMEKADEITIERSRALNQDLDAALDRVSAQQPVTSIENEAIPFLSYSEFLLGVQQHHLSDLKSSADAMRAAAENVLALDESLQSAHDSRVLDTPHVRYAEAVLAKVKGNDWHGAVDVARDDKEAIHTFTGDRSGDQMETMQALLTADLQHAGARLGLDAVEREIERMKGMKSDAKEYVDHPNEPEDDAQQAQRPTPLDHGRRYL